MVHPCARAPARRRACMRTCMPATFVMVSAAASNWQDPSTTLVLSPPSQHGRSISVRHNQSSPVQSSAGCTVVHVAAGRTTAQCSGAHQPPGELNRKQVPACGRPHAPSAVCVQGRAGQPSHPQWGRPQSKEWGPSAPHAVEGRKCNVPSAGKTATTEYL